MKVLEQKLEQFIKKYYKNEILRGLLFFIAIGLTYVLLIVGIEYFFWLSRWGRAFLFWSFIGVELLLLVRLILIPLFRLFKLSKGIDYNSASKLIGNHFPEVRDKLLNTLQLKNTFGDSDLIQASILQKSKELEPVPFSLAINYKKNAKYIKYALIPVLVFVAISLSPGTSFFSESAERVLDYKTEYIPPAPFQFVLLNEDRNIIEGKSVEILAKVEGDKIPEEVSLDLNGITYLMKNRGGGRFSYTVEQATEDLKFQFSGNGFNSSTHNLPVVKTPLISDFKMHLDFPVYLNRSAETIQNTGSVAIPEGTKISWNIDTRNADRLEWISDSIYLFNQQKEQFVFSKRFFNNTDYSIATSNSNLHHYEELNYKIDVIRDAYPELELTIKKDSLNDTQTYFRGIVSDDYGLKDLKLVYYIDNQLNNKKAEPISINQSTVDQFYTAFPGNLDLEKGVGYNYYFEVRDNDAPNGYKAIRSDVQSYASLSQDEAIEKQLELQENSINGLDISVSKMQEQERDLKELQNLQKEKNSFDFNDKRKLKSFLQRQKSQEILMKSYSEKLKNSLNELDKLSEEKSSANELLKKRIENNEKQLEEQEKLLGELDKLQDMMDDEELKDRLDKMSKNSKNSSRSMEQLLELTKRFFIQTKADRIGRQLKKLGEEQVQEGLKKESSSAEKQKELNKDFQDLKEELDNLDKENEELKQPIELPDNKDQKKDIEKEQQEALDKLKSEPKDTEWESQQQKDTKSNQKNAGKKMQKMGEEMMQQMSGGGGGAQQLEEDVEMLRQILDNLMVFSFDQEDLKDKFQNINNSNPVFSKQLVRQNALKDNFKHIDDSLFVLSLRNPMLEEDINKELISITYNLDQTLERLADNDVVKGVSSQQYVFAGANKLADMLSHILDNMNQQLSLAMGSGSSGMPMPIPNVGGGAGKQLSDIIMSQEELQNKLGEDGDKKAMGKEEAKEGSSGEKGSKGEGENGANSGRQNGTGGAEENGISETELARQYEVYKQQEAIRNQLQDLIEKNGLEEEAKKALEQLDLIQEDLLSGNSQNAKKRMSDVIQQFLKLKDAENEKDKNNQRESNSNTSSFQNNTTNELPEIKKYFNSQEILNRDKLPLDGYYKRRVKEYFKESND
ncbi:hypothetical protein [Leeuwenhoekiella marinoflava]|uniref:hypothetical protein n=1 Tax=Leeuwenhoekiella marinoflava TaxID=988 RepID=UPI003002A95A